MKDFETVKQEMWRQIVLKAGQMLERIRDKSPHAAGQDGKYDDMRIDWWTSGFWPGVLWLMYDMTGEDKYREAAWNWDERLSELWLAPNHYDHDVGFQFLPTAVIKHKLTGDEDAARRALLAAGFMAGRFNPAGRFIRAWNGDKTGWSIIDTMMNLSLLFWASEQSGDPRYAHIAGQHADTVVRHFVRPDGSVHHIIRFDAETGEAAEAIGGQGFAPDSAWSRGAAWALYGLTNAYRYTDRPDYLAAAQRVANFFIAHLPEDGVPYWDFRAEAVEAEGGIVRDSSAGAIAASGMLELAEVLGDIRGRGYLDAAQRILHSLYTAYGTWNDPDHEAVLLHGTGHKPVSQNVDVSLIYGDYFFIEAAAKLNGWKHRIF